MKSEYREAIERIYADRKQWIKTELMVDCQISGDMATALIDEYFDTLLQNERLDPLAFNLASQRLNETKEAIFASNWSEKQQEMLADFVEAAAELLEMVKAAYFSHTPPPVAHSAPVADWMRSAMRFIDLCDADAAGYDDLHEVAEQLTLAGYALFGIDPMSGDASLANLEHRSLAAPTPQQHVGGLPPADEMHKLAGWTLDYDFVDQLARKAEEDTGFPATMEVVEFVAIAIAERLQASPAPVQHVGLDGVSLIAAERRRQIEEEGWTAEHDDASYHDGELQRAAAAYVLSGMKIYRIPISIARSMKRIIAGIWPWDEEWFKPVSSIPSVEKYGVGAPVRTLVKAGALIAAEIDQQLRRRAETSGAGTADTPAPQTRLRGGE